MGYYDESSAAEFDDDDIFYAKANEVDCSYENLDDCAEHGEGQFYLDGDPFAKLKKLLNETPPWLDAIGSAVGPHLHFDKVDDDNQHRVHLSGSTMVPQTPVKGSVINEEPVVEGLSQLNDLITQVVGIDDTLHELESEAVETNSNLVDIENNLVAVVDVLRQILKELKRTDTVQNQIRGYIKNRDARRIR